jgi:hypothetical protein
MVSKKKKMRDVEIFVNCNMLAQERENNYDDEFDDDD